MNLSITSRNCLLSAKNLRIHNIKRQKSDASTAQYCVDSVRRYDYENFMCTLLLKNVTRACAFAVRSFNVEVAKIEEQVSDPITGLMRLQFWEDAINSCYANNTAKVPHHPVAIELHKAITNSKVKLSKRFFNNLISSRRDSINVRHYQSLKDIEEYSDKAIASVYYLILEGSGIKNIHADHAASHLSKAQGIIQHIRCTPVAKKLNLIPIPTDILLKNKVSQEEVLRGTPSEALTDCTYEMASRAYQHVAKAKKVMKDVPKEGRDILLPVIAAENYLNNLQKLNYHVLHPQLQQRSWIWLVKLWVKHVQNKF